MGDDRAELERMMQRFLRAVSFREGEQPAYDELRDLFAEGARLTKTSDEVPDSATVDAFIGPRQASVDSGARALTADRLRGMPSPRSTP